MHYFFIWVFFNGILKNFLVNLITWWKQGRVYAVNNMQCYRCVSELQVISFIWGLSMFALTISDMLLSKKGANFYLWSSEVNLAQCQSMLLKSPQFCLSQYWSGYTWSIPCIEDINTLFCWQSAKYCNYLVVSCTNTSSQLEIPPDQIHL